MSGLSFRERSANWVRARPLIVATMATLFVSLLFVAFPSLDLAATRLFFVAGEGFPFRKLGSTQSVRGIGLYLPMTMAIVMAVSLVLKVLNPSRRSLLPPRFASYFLSLYVLGPALLVNGIFKAYWGRPRPETVIEFGGDLTFVDAWSMGGQCLRNCSFVSGEAAGMACFLPLVLFAPRAWRTEVAVLIGLVVAVVSLNRVAFGSHFLSDVVISWGLILMVALALWHVFYGSRSSIAGDAFEAWLTRFGLRLREVVMRPGDQIRFLRSRRAPRRTKKEPLGERL